MSQLATITSKMQLTLPVNVVKKIGLKAGQKVSVADVSGKIVITPVRSLIEELAGSLSMPKKWRGKDADQIIEIAKVEHFLNRKK